MALEPIQQLKNLLGQAKQVLIFLPQNPTGDAIGSGWAFYFFLKRKGIEATLAFSDDTGSVQKFHFLPQPKEITHRISGARDFMLSFNTRLNKITNVRTATEGEEFKIYITPERGAIDPQDFSFIPAKFKYDLVVVLDCPDKESVGKLYEENSDIFYEVPIVNIDHHSTNDNFGQINFVDMTASSTAEILAGLIESLDPFSLDETIVNCLLAGIISATNSFQKRNTTPKALTIAAKLMEKGADQKRIVRYLYKTQPLHILKLWGRVMARLKWDENLGLVWAPVYLEDFVQSRSNPKDLPLILEKIKDNYSTGRIFLVFYNETTDTLAGIAKCAKAEDLGKISSLFGGSVFQDSVTFRLRGKDMIEAEQEIVNKLSKITEQSSPTPF
ncbi:MAG: DHH family phosphoesterase [Candidatus Moranbacteria bacterium]|nr:DHH family phosphoesterase [Candidatus Moranbacteria bacterium]